MTINFALSLSFEGIELLQRMQSGWRRIGRVQISSTTLDADLTELRQKAIALAPDGITTKLIIPSDQIKFTAIDSTQTSQDDIDAVLAEATPYALADLVVDCERFGGRTHIAAVARDTLKEAESFASAHGFNPVAFVAIPEPFTFQKEVFFGATESMPVILGANATVARDNRPVFIAGTRLKSRLLVMDDAELAQEDEVSVADLIEAASQHVTEIAAPAPIAPPSLVHSDIIPAEYWPTPVETAAMIAPQPAPVLAHLPLFDRVIPEFHQPVKTIETPALMALAHAGSAQAPKLGAAAPTANRAPSVAAPSTRKSPLAIAAGVAIAAFIGGLAWSQLAPDDSDAPIMVAEDGPQISEFAATAFGESNTQDTVLPVILTAEASTTVIAAPSTITASAPDTRPEAPQAPPAPPVDEQFAAQVAIQPVLGIVPSPAEAEVSYAATGVWQRSPRFLDIPSGAIPMEFDRPVQASQPLRAAQPAVFATTPLQDFSFAAPANPPSADTVFARDEDGFIQATPEGTLTPDGAVVIAGLPDLNINLRPSLSQDDLDRMTMLAPAPQGVIIVDGRPNFSTPLRPANAQLPQTDEVAETPAPAPIALGGVGLAGLELQNTGAVLLDTSTVEDRAANDLRPQLRPNGLAPATDPNTPDITDILAAIAAEDATLRFDNSTSLAVRASQRPAVRPARFSAIVAAAQTLPPSAPAAAIVAAAPVAPQNYEPVPGGVARAATQEDVIRLRDMNLIGIYGRPNARRALVRLSNGRYVRVEVGSALDGGEVTAIGNEALNYVKRGRTYAIEMPSG